MNEAGDTKNGADRVTDFKELEEELGLFMERSFGEEFNYYAVNYEDYIEFIFGDHGVPKEALNREVLLDAAIDSLEAGISKCTGVLGILKVSVKREVPVQPGERQINS